MTLEKFIALVKPFSMTSRERITELFNSLEYVRKNKIGGDIVECGVWKGGNILGIIEYLQHHNITDKKVWLYDTFQGMTKPEDVDRDYTNKKAENMMNEPIVLALSPLEDVKKVLSESKFNEENIVYVVGDVSETLTQKENIPKKISILRLDTDWYKSTKDELNYLYPILEDKGVLIVDDYGHWQGSKLAVDEYFSEYDVKIEVIDYTGIKIIKNL